MSKRLTTNEFIAKANAVHNFKYSYIKTVYINNTSKVIITCSEHGDFEQKPAGHLTGFGCSKCAVLQRQDTMLQVHGVKHAKQSKQIQAKTKQTMIERHGVEYTTQSPQLIQKIKDNNLAKYGVEWAATSNIVNEARKQTNLDRYGVEYVTQAPLVQQTIKQTNLDRYGVECVLANKDIQKRIKQTNLDRYGVEYALASTDIREQINQTNIDKYGVAIVSQQHMLDIIPLLQNYDWLYEQYITKGRTSYSIAAELGIVFSTVLDYLRKVEIQVRASATGYSYECINWLESIMEKEQIYIQHALNAGEYQIPGTRFKADGYCQETNTIYEFHGDCFHGNPAIFEPNDVCSPFSDLTAGELYNKTIERENQIISLGYNLVVMWASELT